MTEPQSFPLRVVDGLQLDPGYRALLRPGERMRGRDGHVHTLPRFFYEIPSWNLALQTELTPHFMLWEFLNVDVREVEQLRADWPRYIPCAVTLLAACLEVFRQEVDTFVHIAANGGYRSPSHRLSTHASPHCWATAANIYQIGDRYPDDQETIEDFQEIIREVLPSVWVRPFGSQVGCADDHLHLDLGYVTSAPREMDEAQDEDEPLEEESLDETSRNERSQV
jgi:hypothetical protein